jgi:hypothetical protein
MFVGWDWASTTHDVTVLDDAGAVVDRWALRHTEQDLAAALERLARLGEPAALPVIIERTSGHCCIEPECAGEARQSGGSPSWKDAKKGSNHSTVPMICRLER